MEPDRKIIDEIIEIEWNMFRSINEGMEKAACQMSPHTFEAMRRSQFESWNADTCISYLNDLKVALSRNENLPEQKYIHMMRTTDPAAYILLKNRLPVIDEECTALSERITQRLVSQSAELRSRFPLIGNNGRPLYSTDESNGETSLETYQLGELLTYSSKTLHCLETHMLELEARGTSLARLLLENNVRCFGFDSLESAEKYLQTHEG